MRLAGAWRADGAAEQAADDGLSCCQCALQPASTCGACELAYCAPCGAKRHAKGSFRRHATEESTTSLEEAIAPRVVGDKQQGIDDDEQTCEGECDECQRADAALYCGKCELRLCAACSSLTHALGAAARHQNSGAFRFLSLRDGFALSSAAVEGLARSSSSRSSLSSSQSTLSPAGSPFYGSLPVLEASSPVADNQAEPSPVPTTKAFCHHSLRQIDEDARAPSAVAANDALASPTARSEGADAFDLWSGWNAHSFGNRSASVGSADAAPEWRNLRSLSIDQTLEAHDSNDHLPLESLSNSLRSLSVVQSVERDGENNKEPKRVASFDRRPRSFSDYTTLRSHKEDRSPWSNGRDAQQQQQEEAFSPVSLPRAMIDELWKALKTSFATRHVLVKSVSAHFDVDDVRRISDTIHNFGSVARMRSELASEGLLFFTFRELRSAIATVKTLSSEQSPPPPPPPSSKFSPARVLSRAETIHFSLPYELPDDVNCATVVVSLHNEGSSDGYDGSRATPTMIRQFCSRFGEVASVMQTDAHARNKFFVEFNDCRVVSAAVSALVSMQFSFNGGLITAVRAASPTLDLSKIQRFQECVDQLAALGTALGGKARPKSFSSSSTSILTSPTSSVASSLNASFLEAPSSSSSASAADNTSSPSGDSPTPGLRRSAGLSDDRTWSRTIGGGRVRSSSMYASASSPLLDGEEGAPTDRFLAVGAPFGRSAHSMSSSQLTCATYPPAHLSSSSSQFDDVHYAEYSDASKEESNQLSHRFHRGAAQLQPPRMRVDASAPLLAPSSFLSATKFTLSNGRAGDEQSYPQQFRHPSGGFGYQQTGDAPPPARPVPGQGRHDQGTGEFCLSIDRVASGEDARTTLMVRNIPNKYTQQMLLAEINQRHRGQYDFFYLPIDFKNKCNMGYAFINFMEARSIISFYREFDGQKWTNFNSEKVCAISYARLQGKQAMIARFQNSSLLDKHESYRPLVFVSAGPNRGRPEHFPAPKVPANTSYRKHQSPPPTLFSGSPYHHHHHPPAPQHHDEGFAGGMGGTHAAAYLAHHSQQPLPYHLGQQQYYPQQSVLVVDPHQAQAFLAAQMAAAAAIAPGRASYRGMYEDPRYPPPPQFQQQQQRRAHAYESFERRQGPGFGGRARYSSS